MKSTYINLAALAAILLGLWLLAGHWGSVAYAVGGLWGAWHAKKRGGDVLGVGVAWPVRLALIAIEFLASRGTGHVVERVKSVVGAWIAKLVSALKGGR